MSSELSPLNIARVVMAFGRRLIGFKIDMINKPGSLASVLAVTAKHNLNVLCSVVAALSPSDEQASMFLVLDATEAAVEPKILFEELKGLPDVLDIKMAEPEIDGLLIDPFHFPILVGGWRGMIYISGPVISMIERIKKEWGSAGETILFYEGVAAGEALERDWKPLLPGFTGEEIAASLLRIFKSLGWLRGEIVKWDEEAPEAIIRTYDLFECSLAGPKDKPNSHLFRGLLTGLVSKLMGKEVIAMETSCVAKGDPYCEFLIKRR